MIVKLLEFCEWATFTTDAKKLVMGGIFNTVNLTRAADAPFDAPEVVPLLPCYLVSIVEASLAEGLQHRIGLRVRDEDGVVVIEQSDLGPMEFMLNPHGRPLRHQSAIALAGLPLPRPGEYEFEFLVDGSKVGSAHLYVDVINPPTA